MRVLVTGAAGFIGSALALRLLARGDEVIGVDNHNNYYSQTLKEDRLQRHVDHPGYTHQRLDLADRDSAAHLFKVYRPDRVVHLAAQAGVRYSLENPAAYIDSNLVGFGNVLEGCRQYKVDHLVYASSSSVYGANVKLPFSVHDNVDHPLSLYAATKKANELMAHSYSHLYDLPSTGLRFFTVYGPWDRPDMALQKFATSIMRGEVIKVFNNGNHLRDFTFIDDIVEGVICALDNIAAPNIRWAEGNPDPGTSFAPWRVYNIGNSQPVKLLDYVAQLENALGTKANIELLPLQAGDLLDTWANIDDLVSDFNYRPNTPIKRGVEKFVEWFKSYYKI